MVKGTDSAFNHMELCLVLQVDIIFVEPACGKARHSCHNFGKVYVHAYVCACIHPSGFVQAITPRFIHGFQNYLAQVLS